MQTLVTALDGERWRPHVILGQSGPLEGRMRASGVSVEVLPLPDRLSNVPQDRLRAAALLNPARGFTGAAYVVRLARALRREGAELVHANSLRACLLAGLAARLARLRVVWQIHSMVAPPMVDPAGVKLLRWLARWLPDHIICNSRFTAACLDVPCDRVSVIPYGFDAARFRTRGRRTGGPARVGMVGRFALWKGQHIFVDAAARLADQSADAEFVLAGTALFGEDGYQRQVQARAETIINGGRIRFLDFVEDVPALLRDLDIVVHASVQPEPFGQVIVEAMLAGKPVIATAAGGPLELIEDGLTGRLVPPGDPAALATAINELISDPASARRMGMQARRSALERFDLRRTTATVESVYERVLSTA